MLWAPSTPATTPTAPTPPAPTPRPTTAAAPPSPPARRQVRLCLVLALDMLLQHLLTPRPCSSAADFTSLGSPCRLLPRHHSGACSSPQHCTGCRTADRQPALCLDAGHRLPPVLRGGWGHLCCLQVHVGACARMPAHAGACRCMQGACDACKRMQVHTHACKRMQGACDACSMCTRSAHSHNTHPARPSG